MTQASRPPVTVTIIALNEERHIARAIESVRWAEEVVVVDSGSADRTVEIARQLGARVLHHAWPGYGAQKNYAQSMATYDWVLSLDADEKVSEELASELQSELARIGETSAKGYALPRKTYYLGRWIRYGGWYPNYLVRVADRRSARWTEPSVHEELLVDGPVIRLRSALDHYAFSSIHEQLLTNLRYSELGSRDLNRRGQSPSLTKLVFKPLGKFLETYLLKRGFLDGLPGFIISVNAAYSMFLKYSYLMESELRIPEAGS